MLVLAQRWFISELGDDLRALLITTWHCVNLVDGRIRLKPYLDLDMRSELSVALIGSSSHANNNNNNDNLFI